MILQMIKLKTE